MYKYVTYFQRLLSVVLLSENSPMSPFVICRLFDTAKDFKPILSIVLFRMTINIFCPDSTYLD